MLGVGRDLCGSSSPTLLPKQGHLEQAAQELVQEVLEYLQKRRIHSLSGLNLSLYFSFCPSKVVGSERTDILAAPKPLPCAQTPRTTFNSAPTILRVARPPKPTETKRTTKGLWFLQPGRISSFPWSSAESGKCRKWVKTRDQQMSVESSVGQEHSGALCLVQEVPCG